MLDQDHIFHETAMGWLETEIRHGWASCPITQNGCIRIMSNPGYPEAIPTVHVAKRLEEAVNDPAHEFWPDDISLLDSNLRNLRLCVLRVFVVQIKKMIHEGIRMKSLKLDIPLSCLTCRNECVDIKMGKFTEKWIGIIKELRAWLKENLLMRG